MKVKDLLTDKSKWTKHAMARANTTFECSWDSPYAVCFCLMGAVAKCYGPVHTYEYQAIESKITTHLRITDSAYKHPTNYNDYEATFEDIKTLVETLDI